MFRFILAASAVLLCPVLAASAGEPATDWQRSVRIEYRVQPDGRYEADQYFDIQVRTVDAARTSAQQSYGWSSELETLNLVEAYTRKADGALLPVGQDAVLKQDVGAGSNYPSFSDWQVRTLVFPDVQPGDTIHYVLRRSTTESLFPGQFQAALRLGAMSHLAGSEIVLHLPPHFPLHIVTHYLREEPETRDADGTIVRRWRVQPLTSSLQGDWQQAEFTASSFPDYPALGEAFAARALPRSQPDGTIRALAKRLTAGLTSPGEQARALYDYVSGQIRYVGLQLGPGRIVPRPASVVLNSGYGDCKDHVTLLRALLLAVGIESEPALISTKPRFDLPEPATLDVLDHVILRIPSLNAWLDATSSYAPFGVLPIGEYSKPVVVVGPQGARLAHVDPLPEKAAWTRVTTDLDVGDDGRLSGHMHTTAGGPYAVALREIADRLGSVADQLSRLGMPGDGSYDFDPPLALVGDDYSVDADFTLEDTLDDLPDHALIPPPGPTVMVRPGNFLVSDSVTAEGDRLCYSGVQAETIHLHLPATLQVLKLPRDAVVRGGFASFSAHWRRDGADIVVDRRFLVETPRPLCSPAEYQNMKPVLKAARLDLRTRLAFEPAHRAQNPIIAQDAPQATVRPVDTRVILRPASGLGG